MPAIRIECEKCGKRGKVPDKYAGKKIRCPQCQEKIRVPELQYSDAELQPDPGDPRMASASGARRPSGATRKASSRRASSSAAGSAVRPPSGKSSRPASGSRARPSSGTVKAASARSSSGKSKSASGVRAPQSGRKKAKGKKAEKKQVKKKGFNWEPKVKRRTGGPKGEASVELSAKRDAARKRKKVFLGFLALCAVAGLVLVAGFFFLQKTRASSAVSGLAEKAKAAGSVPIAEATDVPRNSFMVGVLPQYLDSEDTWERQAAAAIVGAWHAPSGSASIPVASQPAPELFPLLERLTNLLGGSDPDKRRDVRQAFRGVWNEETLTDLADQGQAAAARVEPAKYNLGTDPNNADLKNRLEQVEEDVAWYEGFFRERLGMKPSDPVDWSVVKAEVKKRFGRPTKPTPAGAPKAAPEPAPEEPAPAPAPSGEGAAPPEGGGGATEGG